MMTISWLPRPNGIIPQNTTYTNEEMFVYAPRLLVDFYESKLKFTKKEEII